MACRVGMSTRPHARIKKWTKDEGHTESLIVETGLTYDEAQDLEEELAKEHGCEQSPGGPRDDIAHWSVYIVLGGTIS